VVRSLAPLPVRTLPGVGCALVDAATWLTELGVGLACLAIAWITARRIGFRPIAVLLAIAGLAAAAHALLQLASG